MPGRYHSALKAFSLSAWLLFAVVGVSAWGTGSATAGSAEVDAAVQAVEEASALAASGDAARAQATLEKVRNVIVSERAAFERLLDDAQSAVEQCTAAVADFDRLVGETSVSLEESERGLRDAELRLQNYLRDGTVSENELRELRKEAERLRGRINARKARLKELEKWWWVPGYGAYLGVRTLVDKDVETLNQLIRDMDEKRILSSRASDRMQRARELARQNTALKTRYMNEAGVARFMQSALRIRLGEAKTATVGVLAVKDFWQEIDRLVAMRVSGAADTFGVELDLVSGALTGTPTGSTEGLLGYSGNLKAVLRELSAGIESGEANARLDTVRCSESAAKISGLEEVKACAINSGQLRWPHIEFIGRECQFRYVYPPGCPGEAQSPSAVLPPAPSASDIGKTTAYMTLKNLAKGMTAQDANWVGVARCTGNGDMFFGKLANAKACENACFGNPSCYIWTYNERNGSIRNTVGECWGVTMPNLSDFSLRSQGGFVSGGVPCAAGERCSS